MAEEQQATEKPELTKDELTIIAQVLGQVSVKVIDAPPFLALVNKVARMAELMDK